MVPCYTTHHGPPRSTTSHNTQIITRVPPHLVRRAKAKADEEDRQRREAEEEAIRELERKTKKFFTVDRKYNREWS